jgi:guanine deaminase
MSLNSGFMPLRDMLESGVKIGLGTDVSGGYSPSMLNAMRMAIATSAVHTAQNQAKPLSHIEAFYLATLGTKSSHASVLTFVFRWKRAPRRRLQIRKL